MLLRAKFYFLFLLLCCGFGMPDLQAQQSEKLILLKISPQHFAINGMHFELEKQVSATSANSILISPRIYYGSVSSILTNRFTPNNNETLFGYGLELGYRIYADKAEQKPEGFYSAFAANYHRFQFKYPGIENYFYTGEDGLEYIGTREAMVQENVNRYGGSVTMGYQLLLLQDKFVVDVYTGGGVKLSDSDTRENRSRYSMGAYDYASSKTFFILGVKLGLTLN